MRKVLVLTGCAGFIGFNFLKYISKQADLREKYHNIISIDKIGYATTYNYVDFCKLCDDFVGFPNLLSVHENINNLPSTNTIDIDCNDVIYDVVNFASESHVDNSIKKPNSIYLENVGIPGNLISFLGMDRIGKFVHISTDEVYGDLPLDTPQDKWFDTNTQLHPNNPYSASKASQDCFLMAMKHTFNLNLRFIRLANQFGPYQHVEKMLPATILRALKGETIKIYGTGLNKRQWTPVVESVKVIYDVLNGKIDDPITHIARPEDTIPTNLEVVEVWRKILKDQYNVVTNTQFIEDRKGHDLMYALKVTPLVASYFTESQQTYFEDSIKHYVKAFNNGVYK